MADNHFKISKGVTLNPQAGDGTNATNGDISYSTGSNGFRAYIAGVYRTLAHLGNKLSDFSSTTSAELNSVISDNTGSGLLVFGTAPTLSAPVISTITNTGTITLPTATTTLVGTDTTDTLTNKTLTSPAINNGTLTTPTLASTAILTNISTPATPSAGTVALYSKADVPTYKNSAGTEFIIANTTTSLVNPMSAVGDIIYGGTSGTATRLAPNTTIVRQVLTETGTGSAGQAPVWSDDLATGSVNGRVSTTTQTFAGDKTFSGQINMQDGSVTEPSIGFSSDDDTTGTGIYRVAANSLGFTANGVNAGQYASTGAWTWGPSTGAVAHTLRGSLSLTVASGTGTPTYGINRSAGNSLDFYTNGGINGSMTSTGIWTLGNGTTGQHTINGGGSAANGVQITSQQAGDQAFANLVCNKASNDTSGAQTFILFQINAGGANSGKISANGANAAQLASTSDERVKENIVDLPPQLTNIMSLRPVEFDYIAVPGYISPGHQIGFIAQEMDNVYPDSVNHEDANNPYKSIVGWSKTEARLVKAIQEQQVIIETLITRLSILEGK